MVGNRTYVHMQNLDLKWPNVHLYVTTMAQLDVDQQILLVLNSEIILADIEINPRLVKQFEIT